MLLKTTAGAAGGARSLALCLLVIASGFKELVAQGRTETSTSSEHALAHDVTLPYGEYEYVPQKGLYKDVNLGDVAEDFGRVFTIAGATVRKLNDYAGWNAHSTTENFSMGIRGGVRGVALPGVGMSLGTGYNGDRAGLHVLLGPLLLDNFYAGFGAMYSDLNGSFPGGGNQFMRDDRFTEIVWLSFRGTILLGDSISISLQPMIYWLPSTGKIGWGMPGPFFGLFLPQMGTMGLFEVAWAKEVGNWKFALSDQFSPLLYQWNIWDVQTNSPFWGDLSPVDRVGRYGVGFGGGDMSNYDPTARLGVRSVNGDPLGGFYNIAGARAYGTHGYNTQSLLYLDRLDLWDRNFRDTLGNSTVRGGAYMQTGDQFLTTYAGYNFVTAEPFNTFFNWAVVGARKRLSSGISAYAQASYYWQSGARSGDGGGMGLVGFQHRISPRTTHSGEIGRRIFTPVRTEPGVENFAEYRLTHYLRTRSTLAGFVGVSQRTFPSSVKNDYSLNYAGVALNTQISSRVSGFATVSREEVKTEAAGFKWDRWAYRLGLLYALSENIQSHCFYQYEDSNGNPFNYTEHYLYLGVTKRF